MICKADVEMDSHSIHNIQKLDYGKVSCEKNWIPFIGNSNNEQKLYFQYSISPLQILTEDGKFCINQESLTCDWNLKWGTVRGAPPPIELNDDTYLAFFHSSIMKHSKPKSHFYLLGAYTFSKSSPFEIKSISKEPIVIWYFYDTKYAFAANRRKLVVYPAGLCEKEHKGRNSYLLTYGSNDSACKYCLIDKETLLNSLIPFVQKEISLPKNTN